MATEKIVQIYNNIYAKTMRIRREWSNKNQVNDIITDAILRISKKFSHIDWVVTELIRTPAENAKIYSKRGKPVPDYSFHYDGLAADIRVSNINGVSIGTVVRFINSEIPGIEGGFHNGNHIHIESSGRRGVQPPRIANPDGSINIIEFDRLAFTEDEISKATYTIENTQDDQILIPDFLKDPTASQIPGATQIGDTWLTIPPIDISIDTTDAHYSMETLRSHGAPKINTGTSIQEISMILEFANSSGINSELRHIIAQFKRTPFTTVRNELVSKALTPIVGGPTELLELVDGETTDRDRDLAIVKEYKAIPMCLKDISVSTIPGFPDSMQATLTVQLFNHAPYYPSFGFVPTTSMASKRADDEANRQTNLINDETIPVADVSESPLYRRYYYGLLPEYNDIPDRNRFGVDEFGNDAGPYVATDIDRQLDIYTPDTNSVLAFSYQFTTDTIFDRLDAIRSTIQKKHEILIDMLKDNEERIPEGPLFPLNPSLQGVKDVSRGLLTAVIPAAIVKEWDILVEKIGIAWSLPGKIIDKNMSGFTSLNEKLRSVVENFGENPAERTALQTDFDTGAIERIAVRLNKLLTEPGGHLKMQEIITDIVEAYVAELKARQGTKPLEELFIIGGNNAGSINGISIPGFATITGISATYNNPITPIQIAQYNIPTMQHMGVGEFGVTINIETDSLELIKQVRVMNALLTHTAFVTNIASADLQSYIDTRITISPSLPGHLLRTLGISSMVIQNISVANIKGSPGTYNISMSLQQADMLTFQAEQLTGTKTITNRMVELAYSKVILWISDRIYELDPSIKSEDPNKKSLIPEGPLTLKNTIEQETETTSKATPASGTARPSGRWIEFIDETAKDYIRVSNIRKEALGLTEQSIVVADFLTRRAVDSFFARPGEVYLSIIPYVIVRLIGKAAPIQAKLIDLISSHNTKAKIIRLIEDEATRLAIGDSDLDDLWKEQLYKQNRAGVAGGLGKNKSIHTCYPDLDLPIINGTNMYTSPSFYLHDKHGMDGHVYSRINASLNVMTDRVLQATVANKAIASDLLDELKELGPLNTSYQFDHRGETITIGTPTGSTKAELALEMETILKKAAIAQELQDTDPRKVQLKSKLEYKDFIESVRDIQILKLITMQGIATSLFNDVKFNKIASPDDRQVTQDLASRFSPSDKSAAFRIINNIPHSADVSEDSIAQLKAFAAKAFQGSEGGEFHNELTQRQAREMVQNLLDEHIRMSQGLETEADQITKYYGMETFNSILRKIDILRKAEELHKNDNTGSFDRAFPTFKLYFIEEDAANWQLFDDFYSYSAVSEISIIKSKRAASDVAIIKLSNISGVLTNPNAVRDAELTGQNTVEEQDIRSLFLRPGLAIAIRMGYGTDPMSLPLVFMGSVSEVPAGEDIEVLCQGWGAELYNPVGIGPGIDIGWDSFDKALGDVATRVLNESGDGLDHFGRWSIFNERDDIRQSGQRKWAESLLGTIGLDWLATTVGRANKLSENIYLSYNDSLLPWTNGTFDWRIFNQTTWDALQEICLYIPNYVVRPMFFNDKSSVNNTEQRMTLYLGPKDGYYRFTDDPLITNLTGQNAAEYEQSFVDDKTFNPEEIRNFVLSDLRSLQTTITITDGKLDAGTATAFAASIIAPVASYIFSEDDTFLDRKLRDRGYVNLQKWLDRPINYSLAPLLTPRYLIDSSTNNSDPRDQFGVLVSILSGSYNIIDSAIKQANARQNDPISKVVNIAFNTITEGLREDIITIFKHGTPAADEINHEVVKSGGAELTKRFQSKHPHYKPFQNHWMIDSYRHIVSNNITADAEGMSNEVILTFPSSEPVMSDPRIGATTVDAMNDSVRTYRTVVDDDIKAEYRRINQTFQKNIDTNWYDELGSFISVKRESGEDSFYRSPTGRLWIPSYIRVANTILANHLAPMYTGEICILGNPGMKPWDVVYIQDDYNDMQGPIEIDTVIHKMSRREGFTTRIVPNAVVYQQSYSSLLDPDFIQWAYYKGAIEGFWGATEGLLFGLPLGGIVKTIGSPGALYTIPIGPPQGGIPGFFSSRGSGGSLARGAGKGLLWLGRRAPAVGVILGGLEGFNDALSTWSGAVGRMFGGNVVHYSGLWLNGQHLQAGLDGLRQNTIQDHRLTRFSHGVQELIYPVGGAPGAEGGNVTY